MSFDSGRRDSCRREKNSIGLDILVGVLADLKGNDPEGYSHYSEEFANLNRFLSGCGFPEQTGNSANR